MIASRFLRTVCTGTLLLASLQLAAAQCQSCTFPSDGPCQAVNNNCYSFLPGTSDCPANTARCDIRSDNGQFDCQGERVCEGQVIVCPPGVDCRVNCIGTAACFQATIMCPSGGYGDSGDGGADVVCDVDCRGQGACAETRIRAGSNQQNGRMTVSGIGDRVLRDAEVTCDGRCSVRCDDTLMPCQDTRVLCEEESVCSLVCERRNSCPGAEIECPAPDPTVDHDPLDSQCILGCGAEGSCRPQMVDGGEDSADYYIEGVTVFDFWRQAYVCDTNDDELCPQDLGERDACHNPTPWRCGGVQTRCVESVEDCGFDTIPTAPAGMGRFMSPQDGVFGAFGLSMLIVGIASVAGIAGVLFFTSVMMAEYAGVEGGHHGRILLVGLALADFLSDVGFAVMLLAIGSTSLAMASFAFIAFPLLLNCILLATIMIKEFKRPEFSEWYVANSTKVTVILLLSVTYIDTLPILFAEGIFGSSRGNKERPPSSMFWGPFSDKSKRRLQWFGIVGNVFEDFPQLGLQLMFALQTVDAFEPAFIIAVVTSALALVLGVCRRMCLVLVHRMSPPAPKAEPVDTSSSALETAAADGTQGRSGPPETADATQRRSSPLQIAGGKTPPRGGGACPIENRLSRPGSTPSDFETPQRGDTSMQTSVVLGQSRIETRQSTRSDFDPPQKDNSHMQTSVVLGHSRIETRQSTRSDFDPPQKGNPNMQTRVVLGHSRIDTVVKPEPAHLVLGSSSSRSSSYARQASHQEDYQPAEGGRSSFAYASVPPPPYSSRSTTPALPPYMGNTPRAQVPPFRSQRSKQKIMPQRPSYPKPPSLRRPNARQAYPPSQYRRSEGI